MNEYKKVKNFYFKCEVCNKQKKRTRKREMFNNKFMCDVCYKKEKLHPINEIPEKGVIKYDEQGRIICHICGRAYDKLTAHIKQAHKMSSEEYKELFEINRTFSLTSEKEKEKYRKNLNLENLKHFNKGYNTVHDTIKSFEGKSRRLQYKNKRIGTKYKKYKQDV